MKKFILIFFVVLLVVFGACNKKNDLPTIGIVQIADDPVLDIARESAIKALKDAGFEDGKNINIEYVSAQGEISNIQMILKSFEGDNVAAILTNSTPCMSAAAGNIKNIPVVFTVAFGPDQIGIKAPDNLYGYYDPLDMKTFLELVKETVPNLKTIGLPYNPGEPNAEYSAKRLIAEAKLMNIEVVTQAVSNSSEIIQAAQALLTNNIDIFVAAADNTMYQGLTTLYSIAEKAKKPIFVTDPYQAKKGAAIGFGVNYQEWGRLSGEMLVKIMKGEKIEGEKIRAITDYQIVVNNKAAKSQNIVIPQNIINKANKIINE